MQYKTIIWYGIASYLNTMVFGILYAIYMGVDMSETAMSDAVRYVSIMISLLVTLAWCRIYLFRNPSRASRQGGLIFGVGTTFVSFFLDAIMWMPSVSQSGSYEQLLGYYSDRRFRIAVALLIVSCVGLGALLHKSPIAQ